MLAAKDYLASSGKLQDEDVESELDDKIWNRSKLIENYSEERYFKLDDLLKQETNKEQERVEEKAEEMQKKYKNE